MSTRYVNPFTDFGFKKLFGEEASKPLLKDFLNSLLPASSQIVELNFNKTEQLGQSELDRKAIYDIYCETPTGEKFIVELQKAKQNYFKDRTIYYSSFPIQEQAQKGDWNYQLQAVYCVGILDFTFDEKTEPAGAVVHTIKLKNQRNEVFYDKLAYIYLEMPNFTKLESELESRLDMWLYFLKHLEDFQEIPRIFGSEALFTAAFAKAALAGMNRAEHDSYEKSLKIYRDLRGVIDTARDEGRDEGRLEGIEIGEARGVAKGLNEALAKMLESGMPEADAKRILEL